MARIYNFEAKLQSGEAHIHLMMNLRKFTGQSKQQVFKLNRDGRVGHPTAHPLKLSRA